MVCTNMSMDKMKTRDEISSYNEKVSSHTM